LKFERYGLGIAKGLSVTIRHLLRHPITTQVPEQRLNPSRRTRGNELIWDKDKCTGCGTCAKACHIGAIHITTSTSLVNNRYEVQKYEVDTGYCIFCGLCVEACPFEALFLSYDYERSQYRRNELLQDKERMTETPEKRVSGYFYPGRAAELPKQSLLVDKDRGHR
jgi:formate hydrogenlyase subunit 6/NADH:ubiquinone oxidoreductase subunit I